MTKISEKRLLRVWLILSAITLLSWYLGSEQRGGNAGSAAVTYGALAIAAVKVRVIVVEFMARRFSQKLQFAMDTWLLLLAADLTAIYAFKLDMPPV